MTFPLITAEESIILKLFDRRSLVASRSLLVFQFLILELLCLKDYP